MGRSAVSRADHRKHILAADGGGGGGVDAGGGEIPVGRGGAGLPRLW